MSWAYPEGYDQSVPQFLIVFAVLTFPMFYVDCISVSEVYSSIVLFAYFRFNVLNSISFNRDFNYFCNICI